MFRSYRCIIIAIAGLASASLHAQEASHPGGEHSTAQQRGSEGSASPTPIASALDRVADELSKTHEDQSDPYGDERNQRERRDLIAQESSAYWAQANFWAMVVQTVVAAIALLFLLLDLKQNRKSAESQLRAYMGSVGVAVEVLADRRCQARVRVENFGQTPAFDVRFSGKISDDKNMAFDQLDWEDSLRQYLAPTQGWKLPIAYGDHSVADDLIMLCAVRYTDVFGREWLLHQRYVSIDGEWFSDKDGNQELKAI